MTEQISPARAIHGVIRVPGDKSISHRYAMLAAIAQGESEIYNYSTGADCASTLSCLEALGARHGFSNLNGHSVLKMHGKGLAGLAAPHEVLDAGNSGSTIRMLSGILAAQPFTSEIGGDESLSKRPMGRIMSPLAEMGARIDASDRQCPPLRIHGSALHGIDYSLPIPSAQVKSCVLLAGLHANGETTVRERITTRDHTEIALRELGADITLEPRFARIRGGIQLSAKRLFVPGDISSAAFFIVAALVAREADLIVTSVGLNPTRTVILDVLRSMGAMIKLLHVEEANGELIGNLQIRTSRIRGGVIEGPTTAALIDEIPILSVLGALSEEGLIVRNAAELRVKETDRIDALARNFRAMGITAATTADGIEIPGKQKFRAATVQSYGDHRIAMAFSIAGLAADGPCFIEGAEAASISFPEFYATLQEIAIV
ncbi:MAG: 3-phosphoshikimate 1-carboxyvinyltransferase [Acidobacteriaceae bacterium]|nr:3-phosphoshikimate 1-carboxyvinyltransferase [Acidobacteriaceae bacterium]MBV9779241.1 3-phosphoshikimate 1-carboxyvinyltransferase [Acidobacteriaceae bacterium]